MLLIKQQSIQFCCSSCTAVPSFYQPLLLFFVIYNLGSYRLC